MSSSRFDYSDDSDAHDSVDDQLSDILGGGDDDREMEPSPPVEPVVKPRSLKLKLSRPSAAPVSSTSTASTREPARATAHSRRQSHSRRSGMDALDEELEHIAPTTSTSTASKGRRPTAKQTAAKKRRAEKEAEKEVLEDDESRLDDVGGEEVEYGSDGQTAQSMEPIRVVKGSSGKRLKLSGESSSRRAKATKSTSSRRKATEVEDAGPSEIAPPTLIEGIVPEAIVKTKKPGAPRKSYKRKPGEPGPGKAWRKGIKKGMVRPGFVPPGTDGSPASASAVKLEVERPGMGQKRFSDAAPSSDVEGSATGEMSARRLKKLKAAHLARIGDGSDAETVESDMPKTVDAQEAAASRPPPPVAPSRKSLFIPIGVKVDLAAPADAELLGHPIFKNHIPGRAVPIKLIPPMPTKAEERERNREIDEMENRKKGASKPPAPKELEIGPKPRKWVRGRRALIGVAGATLLLRTYVGREVSEWDTFKRAKQQEAAARAPPMSLGRLPAIPADGSSSAAPSPALPTESEGVQIAAGVSAESVPPAKKRDPRGRKPGVKNKPKLHSYKDAYRGGASSARSQANASAMETGSAYNSPAASVRADSPVATTSSTKKKNPPYDSESAAGDAASPMDVDAEMDDIL